MFSVELVAEQYTSHMHCGLDGSNGGVGRGSKEGNMEHAYSGVRCGTVEHEDRGYNTTQGTGVNLQQHSLAGDMSYHRDSGLSSCCISADLLCTDW